MFPYFFSDLRFKEVQPGPTGQPPFSKFKSCMKSVSNTSEEQDKSLLEMWKYVQCLYTLCVSLSCHPHSMHTCSLLSWLPSTNFGAGLASLCRWPLPSSLKPGKWAYFSCNVDSFGRQWDFMEQLTKGGTTLGTVFLSDAWLLFLPARFCATNIRGQRLFDNTQYSCLSQSSLAETRGGGQRESYNDWLTWFWATVLFSQKLQSELFIEQNFF